MASWTEQSTDSLLPGKPWTSAKALAAFENPKAIAEGASGAPIVEVAWHLLEAKQAANADTEVLFETDISAYRAIRLSGGFQSGAANSMQVDVDILISSTWRTVFASSGSLSAGIMDISIDRTDADDFKVVTSLVAEITGGANYNQTTGGTYMAINNNSGAATQIRVNATAASFTTATEFNLYGVKRTAT